MSHNKRSPEQWRQVQHKVRQSINQSAQKFAQTCTILSPVEPPAESVPKKIPQCPQCKEIMYDPYILTCGHSFCGFCYDSAEAKTRCPVCRGDRMSGATRDFGFGSFLDEYFAEPIAQRKKEIEDMCRGFPYRANLFKRKHPDVTLEFSGDPEEAYDLAEEIMQILKLHAPSNGESAHWDEFADHHSSWIIITTSSSLDMRFINVKQWFHYRHKNHHSIMAIRK